MVSVITLTTDFGYRDPFAAEMKGVILSINPQAVLVDFTHAVPPQDVREGAFIIGSSYKYFPKGTIHVVVVDPGVGSGRRPIIIEADGHYFVGPDNSVFSYVLSYVKSMKAVHITNSEYMLSKDSPTFQGRDLFAPVAGWLSKGTRLEEFGRFIHDPVRFEVPLPETSGDNIFGEVIYIDSFGNAITNIRKSDLTRAGGQFSVKLKDTAIYPVKFYAQAPDNVLSCLINSSGYLELFVNSGSASKLFNINKGEKVTIQ